MGERSERTSDTGRKGERSINGEGVQRTLLLLELVCESGPITLKDVAAQANLSVATTLRFLRGMEAVGFVAQQTDRRWSATFAVWRLASAVIKKDHWGQRLNRALTDISAFSGETATYALYHRGSVTYVDQVLSNEMVRADAALGRRRHASTVPSGIVCLACCVDDQVDRVMREHWDDRRWDGAEGVAFRALLGEVRSKGHRYGVSDLLPDVWTASVPVLKESGEVVGALIITAPEFRAPTDTDALIRTMNAAAAGLAS